jgi:hypothetical protein
MMRAVLFAAMALAMVTAAAVTRRRRAYWPVLALLAYDLAASITKILVSTYVLRPAQRALEARGMDPCVAALPPAALVAGHVQASIAYLAWPAAVAAVSILVFLRKQGQPVGSVAAPLGMLAVGLAAAVAVLVLGHDHLRCDHARSLYTPAALAGLAVSFGCVLSWWRSHVRERARSPQLEHLSTGILIVLECLAVAVSFTGRLTALWHLAQQSYIVLYSALVVIQGGALWWWSRSQLR